MIKYRKKRVLIVDDEEDTIWSLQKTIPTKNLQVTVFTASSGEEALSILEKTKIDLIVTDNRLPGISGIELLNTIKHMYPDIGVMFMTTYLSADTKTEVMKKGGHYFIDKHFYINDLREQIYNALQVNSLLFIEKTKNMGRELCC